MIKIKSKSKIKGSLIALFLIGLIFIYIYFLGGSASLINQNISNWPKTEAEVISIEKKIVCETPERSGACYPLFLIKSLYYVNSKKYINETEQMYATDYITGKTFDLYYNKDNPELAFGKNAIPQKSFFYLPLLIGLIIIISVVILLLFQLKK